MRGPASFTYYSHRRPATRPLPHLGVATSIYSMASDRIYTYTVRSSSCTQTDTSFSISLEYLLIFLLQIRDRALGAACYLYDTNIKVLR